MNDWESHSDDSYVFSEPIPLITAGATVGFVVGTAGYEATHLRFHAGASGSNLGGHEIAMPQFDASLQHANTHKLMQCTMESGIIGAVAVAVALGLSRASIRKYWK
jgi:hypothetical protein